MDQLEQYLHISQSGWCFMEYPVGMTVLCTDSNYQRIQRLLEEEFHAAIARRDAASIRFDEMRKILPSRTVGTQRIAEVFSEYSAALNALSRAALRVTNFEVSGVVPDDLKGADCGSSLEGPVT
jgi:hypothetical protein